MSFPKVYVVVVNYKNWRDTLECLESLLRINYSNCQIVVVDNGSPDNSIEFIKTWAEGKLNVWQKLKHPLRYLSFPPIEKPVPYVCYTREEAEKGGDDCLEKRLVRNVSVGTTKQYPLVFIKSDKNLGFAGGNNVGIRYALSKGDFEYLWILNNDTVVEKSSLTELVSKFKEYRYLGRKVGIVGSKLLYYGNPSVIQSVGGVYNKYWGIGRHVGNGEIDKGQYDTDDILRFIDHIIGASMFVSKEFIEDVGLMCEDYFLYFEELDWAFRGRKKGWELGYAWKSRVYHREGGTTGADSSGKGRNEEIDYYWIRNRILFTKKFFPRYLPSVYLGLFFSALNRIRRGQISHVKNIFRVLVGK